MGWVYKIRPMENTDKASKQEIRRSKRIDPRGKRKGKKEGKEDDIRFMIRRTRSTRPENRSKAMLCLFTESSPESFDSRGRLSAWLTTWVALCVSLGSRLMLWPRFKAGLDQLTGADWSSGKTDKITRPRKKGRKRVSDKADVGMSRAPSFDTCRVTVPIRISWAVVDIQAV